LYEPFARTEVFVARPNILVRSGLPVSAVVDVLRVTSAGLDPAVPVSYSQSLQRQIDRVLTTQRVFTWVLSLLGGLGIVLAAVGLYGLLAQTVTERTREFGIRMALGATGQQVFELVLRQAGFIAATGGLVGVCLALAGSRLFAAHLWGVTARVPWVYLMASTVLLAVALRAATLPGRAATRVEPMRALRVD
jgi:ABC-type antimicrobial peptide transport system permease subunit